MLDEAVRQYSAGFSRGTRRSERGQIESAACPKGLGMYPAPHAIYKSCHQWFGHVGRQDFCVKKATVAPSAAIGRKLQIPVQDALKAAVRVRFPDRPTSALGAFVKLGLAPKGKSQSHTPDVVVRDLGLIPVAARKATHTR